MTDPATPDPTPTPDPAPATDAAPAMDPRAAPDSVPAADSGPPADSTSAAGSVPAADSMPADPTGTQDSVSTADSTPAADPPPGADSGPALESPASTPGLAAGQPSADLPPSAQDDSAQNGSASGNPWAVASAESAAAQKSPGLVPDIQVSETPASADVGPAETRSAGPPPPAAAPHAASGTGWADPAGAQRDSGDGTGTAAAADQPAAGAEALTGKVSPVSGRGPGDRRGPGSSDAWTAATDPIGPVSRRSAEDGGPKTGPQPSDAAVSGTPAPRWDAGPGGDRDKIRSVPARRPAPSRPETRRPAPPGSDLLGDLQRWLIRSGTKSMRREIEGQVRRTLGGRRRAESADAWGTATTEPPSHLGDSPECAWCPICRAARRMRESGPDLGSQLSGASDVVASAVQDAIVAVDAIFSRTASASRPRRPADGSPDSGHADSAGDSAERVSDEPGDRG
jgi:hypothetical protein